MINTQLNNLDLRPIKYTKNKNHLFGDFYELVTLFNEDGISRSDFIQRYKTENIPIYKLFKDENEVGSIVHEESDKEELWADEILAICEERSSILGGKYPFEINNNSIRLKSNLDSSMKIYIILLLASNLNYFPDFKSNLTTDFERISYECLGEFLPEHAILRQFGKNSDYKGNAKTKIKALAKDMNITINENEIKKVLGNQERGLDVIGWIPFEDRIPNFLTIIGQCACGKEWYKKQHETKRYESAYFNFYRQKPIHAMFIPYALYTNEDFYQSDELIDGLLFERNRIIQFINETEFINEIDSANIVDSCIKFQESIA